MRSTVVGKVQVDYVFTLRWSSTGYTHVLMRLMATVVLDGGSLNFHGMVGELRGSDLGGRWLDGIKRLEIWVAVTCGVLWRTWVSRQWSRHQTEKADYYRFV